MTEALTKKDRDCLRLLQSECHIASTNYNVQMKRYINHRGKIASTINNAQRAQALRSEFGSLAAYFWQFEPQPTTRPERLTYQSLSGLTTSAESIALSKDLRKRGWSFVGPTTMYAFMQAMGLVNDHLEGCTARQRALQARTDFSSPARDSNA